MCDIAWIHVSLSLSLSLSLQSTLLDCLLEQTHPELLLKEDKQVRKELDFIRNGMLQCYYMYVCYFLLASIHRHTIHRARGT